LAALAVLAISCSLTNATTSGAAVLNTPTARPQRADTLKAEQTPTTSPTRCTVTAHALNVRDCGGVDCAVIDQVTQGDRLTVTGTADGWHRVQLDAGAGWINSKYCKEIGE
jgi:uncharacterized protein YgiM (DUF1202 family)